MFLASRPLFSALLPPAGAPKAHGDARLSVPSPRAGATPPPSRVEARSHRVQDIDGGKRANVSKNLRDFNRRSTVDGYGSDTPVTRGGNETGLVGAQERRCTLAERIAPFAVDPLPCRLLAFAPRYGGTYATHYLGISGE